VAGVDCVRNAKKIKRMVGYMPDKFGSYENMRVLEYLDFFGAAFGLKRRDRRRRIEEVMEMSGTTYMRDMLVDSLSHGMSQRLGITRTLLHDPQVLILDEPANGLDPLARIEMRELLLKLADAGKTLLVTSHILPELSRICHRIAILAQGKLRACGNVAEISRQISPRRTMEVQLNAEADVSQAAEVIRRHMEDEDEVVPAPAERLVRCRTLKSEAELGELLATLVSSGIQVTQFRELQTDLEEAFMTFARESAGDDVPEVSASAESGN
jgi:ABC-2 type transport system ATP-binding protein